MLYKLPDFYRGLIIVYPHANYIIDGSKSIIIKSLYLPSIVDKQLLLIQNKKAIGLLKLRSPKEIDIKTFSKLYNKHRITEEERKKWWKNKRKLYLYKIYDLKVFKKPIIITYPQGPQVLVKPENIHLANVKY